METVDHGLEFAKELLEILTRLLYADLVAVLLEDPELSDLLPKETSNISLGSPLASGQRSSHAPIPLASSMCVTHGMNVSLLRFDSPHNAKLVSCCLTQSP
jgi:hypothetical protein